MRAQKVEDTSVALAADGRIDQRETFDGYLKDQGYLAMGGQIIDASIVAVPKQRNSREENARIKAGETPAGWEEEFLEVPEDRRGGSVGRLARAS